MLAAFKIREIDPSEIDAFPSARVIDVREPHELIGELGRLPRAEPVPLATVPEAAAAWDREQIFIMVCRSGGRSGRAAEVLARLGFRRVINLRGGMLAVQAAGLKTTRSPG
jgi:sulfur dioxygenase